MNLNSYKALIPLLFLANLCYSQQTVWGVTSNGGKDNLGTIGHYSVGESKWITDFGEFTTDLPGASPTYTQLTEFNGKFYGTTPGGGAYGTGVLFEWNPVANTYIRKVDFVSETGSSPMGSLVYHSGKFYGVTQSGGANNAGVIFEWNPGSNTYAKKFDFSTTEGSSPYGLTFYDGKFYGITFSGGTNVAGVLFEWDPSANTYLRKYNFSTSTGSNPQGPLIQLNGKFYGMTVNGGTGTGVIFEWDPITNNYSKKIDLPVGSGPTGSLTYYDGKFYGVTRSGGANFGGVLFEWNPSTNIYTPKIELSTLSFENGVAPQGTLLFSEGKFYGMTQTGGIDNSSGVIFEWDPVTNVYNKKMDFTEVGGRSPLGSLTFLNGKFYGMTNTGGLGGAGVLFEWNPVTNVYNKKVDFSYAIKGRNPQGSLSFHQGKFYGTTYNGGLNGCGVIFEWNPATATFTKKIDFVSQTGSNPREMVLYNGKYYGVTQTGGTNNAGVIYEWDPATNIYTKKFDMTSAGGSNTYSALTLRGGKFYGTTEGGGIGSGTIFEWDPSTNVFTKKIDFAGTSNGRGAISTLVDDGTDFYSTTFSGGINNSGVIYKWDPGANVITKKIDFGVANGIFPKGITYHEGIFYGITINSGSNNAVLYEWVPATNVYTKKIIFDGSNGKNPTKILFNGQTFYGAASLGGLNNAGIFFEWNHLTNTLVKKIDFSQATGAIAPYTQLLLVSGLQIFQKIDFTAIPRKTPGDTPFNLTAISSAGLPVSYTSSDPSIASVSGSTVTIHKAGTVSITASQSGNENYLAASSVEQSLLIGKPPQTIVFTAVPTKTIGDPVFNLTATSTSGLAVAFSTTSDKIALSGSQVTIVKAGSVTITATQAGNENFEAATSMDQTFCINPVKPTVILSNLNTESPTLTSSSSTNNQWYLNDTALAGATNATYTATAAGIYKVQVKADNCLSAFSNDTPLIVTGDLKAINQPISIIYPNPVEDYLVISGLYAETSECMITDMTGRTVLLKLEKQNGTHRADVRSYGTGLYLVRVQSGSTIQQIKFIKK